MLNITVKPGEYFVIGEDIKVIFAGGTANNARVMIDAPRSYNVVRGKVLEQKEGGGNKGKKYYAEPKLSEERLKGYLNQQKQNSR